MHFHKIFPYLYFTTIEEACISFIYFYVLKNMAILNKPLYYDAFAFAIINLFLALLLC